MMETRKPPIRRAENVRLVISVLEEEGAKKKPNWKAAVSRGLKKVETATAETFLTAQTAMLALGMKVSNELNLYDVAQQVIGEGKFANGVAAASKPPAKK